MKRWVYGDLSLIKHNVPFRRLFYAETISGFGNWLNSIAVLSMVLQLTGSAAAVGMTLALRTFPYLVMGPVGGVWSDRIRRTRMMIGSDLARAVIALGFLLVTKASDLWLVYLLTTLLVVFSALFVPASSAYRNSIVEKNSLAKANALSAASNGAVMVAGMAVGGLITGLFGVEAAFILNSLSFLASAWLLKQGAGVERAPEAPDLKPAFLRELAEGFRAVTGNRPVSLLFLLEIGWSIGGGAVNVLISVVAHETFKMGSVGVGIAYASLGVGTVAGSIAAARLSGFNMRHVRLAAGIAFLLDALLHILFANSTSAIMGNIALAGAGLAGAIGNAAIATLLGLCTDNRVQGRVYALFSTIGSTLLALSMAGVGMLIPAYGTRAIGTAGGCIILCFAAVYLLLVGKGSQTKRMESDGNAARSAGELS